MKEEIPKGKVQIRRLDPLEGDKVEIVDAAKVSFAIKEYELIVDEDTMKLVQHDELQAKVETGEVRRVRAVTAVRGG